MNKQITKSFATEQDTMSFAATLANAILPGAIIYLQGPLGAGKTTFTRGFLRSLGYEGKVKSPTYTLVEPYEIGNKKIFHFDFYRLNDPHELEHIGIEEYFTDPSICIIEWPEKGMPLIPQADLACYLDFKNEGREMSLEARTEKGTEIVAAL